MFTSINFYNSLPAILKYFLCLFPNLAFSFAMQVIFQFERSSKYILDLSPECSRGIRRLPMGLAHSSISRLTTQQRGMVNANI